MSLIDLEEITPKELKNRLLKDQNRETIEELKNEYNLREDIEYAIEVLNINDTMTVNELLHAVKMLNLWGHNVTVGDILDII